MEGTTAPDQVTNATCDFGLAGPDCIRTFASYDLKTYQVAQICYFACGGLAMMVSTYKYLSALRHLGSNIQRRVFLWMVYCSLTFLVRGVDPLSYKHVLPRFLTLFLIDSCTAGLYTVFIMCCVFWTSVIQQVSHGLTSPRVTFWATLAYVATWVVFMSDAALVVGTKGFSGKAHYLKLTLAPVVLFFISVTSFVFGYRIHRRLQYINDLMHEAEANRSQDARNGTMNTDADDADTLSSPSLDENPYQGSQHHQHQQLQMHAQQAQPQHHTCTIDELPPQRPAARSSSSRPKPADPAKRILKILVATVLLSIVAICLQLRTVVKNADSDQREIKCANGVDCENLHLNSQGTYILQYAAMWVILWSFRKIKKSPEQ